MNSLINLDQNIFSWFNAWIGINPIFDNIVKIAAVYTVYSVPVLMLFFWFYPRIHPFDKLRAGKLHEYNESDKIQTFLMNLFVSVLISWQGINRILGEWINRPRPDTFAGTKEVFFHPPTYSFPSDHALFFAFMTTYLYLNGYNKMGNIVLVATLLISLTRVIGGFHWPGDILAGWIGGVLLAYLFYKIKNPLEKYLSLPLIWLAKKMRLV